MAWPIQCTNCDHITGSDNVRTLLEKHRDERGLFRCTSCRSPGYIEQEYKMQDEEQEPWRPYLRGALLPRSEEYGHHYQPFVFLVSYEPTSPICSTWFCYYKDYRDQGGQFKMGHGPGGPPVLGLEDLEDLSSRAQGLSTEERLKKLEGEWQRYRGEIVGCRRILRAVASVLTKEQLGQVRQRVEDLSRETLPQTPPGEIPGEQAAMKRVMDHFIEKASE